MQKEERTAGKGKERRGRGVRGQLIAARDALHGRGALFTTSSVSMAAFQAYSRPTRFRRDSDATDCPARTRLIPHRYRKNGVQGMRG